MAHMSIVLAVIAAVAAPTVLPAQKTPPAAAAPVAIPIRDDGLVATWFPPASGKRGPVILALGGSEGGEGGGRRIGAQLAGEGYGVLALAYFRAPGLPQTLQEIPLDYFDRAIAWLARQPLADPRRIGLYGISIGGETALVVAARHPELKAVVAVVPSSVVWQGFDPADYRSVTSTYADHGVPVPYLPYRTDAAFTGVYDLYQRSLAGMTTHPDAIIPVERIGGAVLLLSARDDQLWPSSVMADQVMARLDANHFAHPHEHVAYPDTGHGGLSPGGDTARNGAFDNLGGTPAGNSAARAAMWPRLVSFFGTHLGRPAR